jgi:hypothetical protein
VKDLSKDEIPDSFKSLNPHDRIRRTSVKVFLEKVKMSLIKIMIEA